MPTPQFGSPLTNWGFDKDATPPWMVIATRSTKLTLLDYAKWNVVKTDNSKSTLKEVTAKDTWASFLTKPRTMPDYLSPPSRWFNVTGVSPGITKVYVSDPDAGNSFALRLEIEVKENKRFKIAYHFVDKTTYSPSDISSQVHTNLNYIYEEQANVSFDNVRLAPSPTTATLHSLIFELKNGDSRRPNQREWNRLVDWADKSADFNVYFMPWDGRPEERPTEMLAQDNHIICPDGMELEDVERGLAHEIGRFLGCSVTHSKKQQNHLMFRFTSDNGDLVKFVRSGDYLSSNARRLRNSRFIPKDCANTVNPTFP